MWSVELWTLVATWAGVVINLVLFVGFWIQLSLFRRQVRQSELANQEDHDRRKKQATIDFWAQTQDRRLALAFELPLDRDTEAIKRFLKKVGQKDSPRLRTLTDFLGLYEMLATGINAGVFDFELFAVMAGPRITSVAENYGAWIRERRKLREDPLLYDELTKLADKLTERWELRLREGGGRVDRTDVLVGPLAS